MQERQNRMAGGVFIPDCEEAVFDKIGLYFIEYDMI